MCVTKTDFFSLILHVHFIQRLFYDAILHKIHGFHNTGEFLNYLKEKKYILYFRVKELSEWV